MRKTKTCSEMWINEVLSYEKIIPMFFRIVRLGNDVLKVSRSVDANGKIFDWCLVQF